MTRDSRRLGYMINSKKIGTSSDLCSARSDCQTCLGSKFCCRHAIYVARSKLIVSEVICVCGNGCTIESLGITEEAELY